MQAFDERYQLGPLLDVDQYVVMLVQNRPSIEGNVIILDRGLQFCHENALGVIDVAADKKLTDNYAVGEQMRIINGPGCKVKLKLTGGENVAPGDQLQVGADGKVVKKGTGSGMVVAQALESSNVTADAWIAAKLLI